MNKYVKYFITGAIAGILLLFLSYTCTLIFPAQYRGDHWDGGSCQLYWPIMFPTMFLSPAAGNIVINNMTIRWILIILIMAFSYGLMFVFIGSIIHFIRKIVK